MSLVAYGCESDESDDESAMDIDVNNAPDVQASNSFHLSSTPKMKYIQDPGSNINMTGDHRIPDLKFLVDENEEALEDMVKAKPTQISGIVKPSRKDKQPVRITIPALVDDDEDSPAKKKARPSSTKCGLFDLLPAPHNVSAKETNRILVPHSVTKRRTFKEEMRIAYAGKTAGASVAEKSPNENQNPVERDRYSDSDSETADVNFFSFGQNDSVVEPQKDVDDERTVKCDAGKRLLCTNVYSRPLSDSDDADSDQPPPETPRGQTSKITLPPSSYPSSRGAAIADQPLQFSGRPQASSNAPHVTASYNALPAVSKMYETLYPRPVSGDPTQDATESSNDQVHDPDLDLEHPDPDLEKASGNVDVEFLKMQGRRGRTKEHITMIDVDCNDFTGPIDPIKNISQEVPESRKRAKKDDAPTSQQRRKHQITYLAFQAKERELDLKNQWSQNRMTKRQTQAKYGF